MGAINSVAQFVRVIMIILKDYFPKVAILFVDDIEVKRPYIDYDNKLAFPGIRRYVYEYIQNLDITLDRIKKAQVYISIKS